MLTFDLSLAFGRVRLRASTRVDFLPRMSTGDLRGLRAGEGRPAPPSQVPGSGQTPERWVH